MGQKEKCYHLKSILEPQDNQKIVIDDAVMTDDNGNFLVNVGYLRVSTDRQADVGFGLEIQEADILRYCRANNFPNLLLFIDDGYTGTNMDRPALQSIISYINAFNTGRSNIRINSLIVARIDRLGRSLLGTLQFIQDYIVSERDSKNSAINRNKEDIGFISVAENYCRIDKDNPQGKFLLMLFATLAEFDRDQIVEKLKRGRTARVASGKWMGGGNIPYGYRYNRERGTLIVEPKEAEILREVFRLYLEEKMPPQKIADRFGFSGDRTITQFLRRKTLAGYIIYNGVEYKGDHEPIISLETWEAAQAELDRRSSHRTASEYMLSGLVYCGECGAKMRYQQWGKTGKKLICYSQQKGKPKLRKSDDCDNERFWSDDVEKAVIAELFKLKYLGNENNVKSPPKIDPIAVLRKKQTEERRKLSRLYDFEDEDDSDDVLKEKILNVKKRIAEIDAQIREEEEKSSIENKIVRTKGILRTLQSTWPHMTDLERQTTCQELIEKVVIHKNKTIEVHLKLESFLISSENT